MKLAPIRALQTLFCLKQTSSCRVLAMSSFSIVRRSFLSTFISFVVSLGLVLFCSSPLARAADADPALSEHVVYVEDGPLSKELHLPICEWYPENSAPSALLLAIHGLTLHGKRYDVLGRAFALEGFYTCAPDMRGFGRCYTDTEHKFCVG